MGLFPEIGRAWLTAGNNLYLWSFENNRDFTCYTKSVYEIIDVALVPPIPGVFVDAVKWVLVLVTPVEIVLLAVSFDGDDLVLHETELRFPTDEVNMVAVVGVPGSGRLFLAGSDGNIYELVYRAEGDWLFGGAGRCKKINRTATPLSLLVPTFLRLPGTSRPPSSIVSMIVDAGRGLLWGLGEDSSIWQYWLGPDGRDFQLIAKFSGDEIVGAVGRIVPAGVISPSSASKSLEIVSLFPIERAESTQVTLLAICRTGIRLYFGKPSFGVGNEPAQSSDATPVRLLHVRAAPEENRVRDPKKLVHRWAPSLHTAFYRRGVCLTANSVTAEEDVLLGMILNPSVASLSAKTRLPLEYSIESALEGKVWSICELKSSSSADNSDKDGLFDEFSLAHLIPKRGFAVLTNVGVYLYSKLRPIDQLSALLTSQVHLNWDQLQRLFEAYGADQACSFCVALCCSSSTSKPNSNASNGSEFDWATVYGNGLTVLLRLGGNPKLLETSFYSQQPHQQARQNFGRIITTQPEFENSSLHDGLYAYFSRLVSGLWKRNIWTSEGKDTNTDWMKDSYTKTASLLFHFHKFLIDNLSVLTEKRLIASMQESTSLDLSSAQRLQSALESENESILALKETVGLCLEVLAFLSLAGDYRLFELLRGEPIAREYGDADLELLSTQTRGRNLLIELGNILVSRQLKLKIPTRPLCESLRTRCPSFFSIDDINLQEAMEALERAANRPPTSPERADCITEAMTALLASSRALSLQSLMSIFDQLDALGRQDASLRLGLQYASHLAESTDSDVLKQSLYVRLMDSLGKCGFFPERTLVIPGVDVDAIRSKWLALAVASSDASFHDCLYTWLLSNRFVGTLLDLPPNDHFQRFLLRDFTEGVDDELSVRDLLWKWLVRRGRFAEAAAVLYQLAASTQPGQKSLSLSERIEYLSLAVTNAHSQNGKDSHGSDVISMALKPYLLTITQLEEALEVAQLQLEVLQEAKSVVKSSDVITQLDGGLGLLGVTEMFNDYARPLQLTESCLKLVHTSGLINEVLVSQLWAEWLKQWLPRGSQPARQRLLQLCRRLYPSPGALPLGHVIDQLGREVFASNWGPEWLPGVLLEAGVPAVSVESEIFKLLQASGGSKAWLTNSRLRQFGLTMCAVVFACQGLAIAQASIDRLKQCAVMATELGDSQLSAEFTCILRDLAK